MKGQGAHESILLNAPRSWTQHSTGPLLGVGLSKKAAALMIDLAVLPHEEALDYCRSAVQDCGEARRLQVAGAHTV